MISISSNIDISSYHRYDQLPDDASIITVSHRYITDYDVTALIKEGITKLLVKSPTASGKTELINHLVGPPHSRVLIVAHRRSLVAALVKRLNRTIGSQTPFVSYDKLSASALRQATRLVICTNSLPKLIALGQPLPTYDLIVFDEIEQQLKHLTGGTFEGSEAVETLCTMNALAGQGKLVVGLDAYASSLSLNWLKTMGNPNTFRMIINGYLTPKGAMHLMKDLPSLLVQADKVLTTSQIEGPIVFGVASKAVAKWLYSYYTGRPILTEAEQTELLTDIDPQIMNALARSPHTIPQNQVVIVYGDNTDSTETRNFLSAIDERLSKLKVLIHTSAIGTGLDIQASVKAVFGLFRSGILPADEALQMLARCRKAFEFYVLIESKSGNREINPEQLYQTQIDKIRMTGSLLGTRYRTQWYVDEAGLVQMDCDQQTYLKFWSQVTGHLNHAHNTFRKQFIALAQREFVMDKQNHSQIIEAEMTEEQVEQADILAHIKMGVKGVDQHLILTCMPISHSNYQHYQSEYQVTPAIYAGYIRWTIERGYRQTITPMIYEHWLRGGLGHLYQFIRLYNPLSELQDYDLNQAVDGYAIPSRSHATACTRLIQRVLTLVFSSYMHLEQTDHLSKQVINERLVEFITRYQKELRVVFGWRSSQDVEPMNVLRRLVSELGLKMPKSRSGDSKGKYGICREYLAEMQSYYEAYQTQAVTEMEVTTTV